MNSDRNPGDKVEFEPPVRVSFGKKKGNASVPVGTKLIKMDVRLVFETPMGKQTFFTTDSLGEVMGKLEKINSHLF